MKRYSFLFKNRIQNAYEKHKFAENASFSPIE